MRLGPIYQSVGQPSALARLRASGAVAAAVAGAPASFFTFSDDFNSGTTNIRDRTGWQTVTYDTRSLVQANIVSAALTKTDGVGSNYFSGQDLGRIDGGIVQFTIGSAVNNLFLNWQDQTNNIKVVQTLTRLQIYRVNAGVQTNLYDSFATTTWSAGDVMAFSHSWSGTTCTIVAYKNGSRFPNGSTSWTFSSSTGLLPASLSGVYTSTTLDTYSISFNGASALPRLTLNKLNKVYQRSASDSSKAITLGGVATGVTAVQFRLLQNGAVVTGWDWGQQSLTGFTNVGGVWAGTTPAIAQGQNYTIEVRDSIDNLAGSRSRVFGVGSIFIIWGQSLSTQSLPNSGSARTTAAASDGYYVEGSNGAADVDRNPFVYALEWDWNGPLATASTGPMANSSVATFLGALRAVAPTIPLAVTNLGYGSQQLTRFLSTDTNVPFTGGPARTLWQNLTAAIDYFGGDIEGIIWTQGQDDAGRAYNGTGMTSGAATTYKTNFVTLATAIRSYVGRSASQLPIFIAGLGRLYPPSGTISTYTADDGWDNLRRAQFELARDNTGVYLSHTQMDLVFTGTPATNEVHLSAGDMGYPEDTCRMAHSIAKQQGWQATDRRGPLPLSAAISGSTIAITFDANGATALTCAAGIAKNFTFWTSNTYTTALTPTSMSIAAVGGGQCVVTFTFGSAVAAGAMVTMGSRGAYTTGGIYPDAANSLKGTQADGRSVITFPIFTPIAAT